MGLRSSFLLWLTVASILFIPAAGVDGWAAGKKGKRPRVELLTSMGRIVLELFPDRSPKTVANFLAYVRSGHYAGTIFHRVMDGFMVQGGGFTEKFEQKKTRPPVRNEASNGLKNEVGTVAMARTKDPHSASAQFFINVADNSNLDHRSKTTDEWGYAVFGKVVEGMDVVNKIKAVRTGAKGPFRKNAPLQNVVIRKARLR